MKKPGRVSPSRRILVYITLEKRTATRASSCSVLQQEEERAVSDRCAD